ncbi:MAG: triose-phosphate isomerase [Bdellovibrionaceae bacterium]|nr:triose-phosphate isomerase [Bdellovibrio sp.]
MSNKKIFAANWKLNKTPEQAREFVIQFKNEAFKHDSFFANREVILFPPAFALEAVSTLCAGTQVGFGPQNIFAEKAGAFTGENSAEVASTLKAQFALVGHSERREVFKEADELLNKKNHLIETLKMTSVFCVGESLKQREAFQTLPTVFAQLDEGLQGLFIGARIIIAYEPVWAIGTGKVATLAQVAEVHEAIYAKVTARGFTNFQILYGGSVKPDNAGELLKVPHVDGFLIGGASLEVASFMKVALAT